MSAEDYVQSYAIPGNNNEGRLYVVGEASDETKEVMLFIAGFPDDSRVFLPMAQRFAIENPNVLTGVTCLPGYDHQQAKNKWEGYSMDEMVATVRDAAKMLCSFAPPTAKLTGIFHDWGCIVGAVGANRLEADDSAPQKFGKLVYFDVLPPSHPSHAIPKSYSWHQWVVFPCYSLILTFIHLISRYMSWIAGALILIVGTIMVPFTGLAPLRTIDEETYFGRTFVPSIRTRVYMCYPYYQLYKAWVLKKLGMLEKPVEYHLPANLDSTPVLYMYGLDKNINFHNDNDVTWLKKHESLSHTRVVAVEEAGHWLFEQQPEICYEVVRNFILGSK